MWNEGNGGKWLKWHVGTECFFSRLPYHVLVSIRPVLLLALLPALENLVDDCVPVDGGVEDHPGTLPRHHDGGVVLGVGLNVLWLWGAGWRQEKRGKKKRLFNAKHRSDAKSWKQLDGKWVDRKYKTQNSIFKKPSSGASGRCVCVNRWLLYFNFKKSCKINCVCWGEVGRLNYKVPLPGNPKDPLLLGHENEENHKFSFNVLDEANLAPWRQNRYFLPK